MPTGRSLAPLADIPDCQRHDGPPELVIGREYSWLVSRWQAMPGLPRWRHEIGEPVQKLKRRELDDAIGRRRPGAGHARDAHGSVDRARTTRSATAAGSAGPSVAATRTITAFPNASSFASGSNPANCRRTTATEASEGSPPAA